MFANLRELVFGLGEFDKVKIELRLEQVKEQIKSVSISSLQDFEILEDISSKLKDELRIKSSNLNKVINNPLRKLTKKNVFELLEELQQKKQEFITRALHTLEVKREETPLPQEEPEELTEEPTQIQQDNSLLTTQDYSISLEQGKVLYLLVKFTKQFSLTHLKNLSSLFFDIYKAQGTNIIVEDNKALIIPRIVDDTLITLPQIQDNLDETFKLLTKQLQEGEYVEKELNPKERPQTHKLEEESLDSLLLGIEDRNPVSHFPAKEEYEEQVEIVPDDEKIEIEKKDEVPPQITIENEEVPIEIKDDEPHPLILYQDKHIIARVNDESSITGEIIVEPVKLPLEQSDMSYLLLFSKVFASVLFETLQAHGTNIMWKSNETQLKILPRYKDDTLGLLWEPKQVNVEELDKIRKRLLEEMHKEKQKEEIVEEEAPQIQQREPQSEEQKVKNQEKVDYLLKSIQRLP